MSAPLTFLLVLLLFALPSLLTSSLSGARPLGISFLLLPRFSKLFDLVPVPLALRSGPLPALHLALALRPLVPVREEGGEARRSPAAEDRPVFFSSRSVGRAQTFVKVELPSGD